MHHQPDKSIEEIILEDGRYPLEAVQFVREGLNHTIQMFHPEKEPGQRQHVGGDQLCEGMKHLAMKRWGFMARSVLKGWNITSTRDFGEIVFLLVDSGWMMKESQDCIEDFDNVFDFQEVLERDYEIEI